MQSNIRPLLGFSLAMVTAVLWGVLPLFLILCLQAMDSPTITLYRFASAACVVAVILALRGRLPSLQLFKGHVLLLSLSATLLLVINYVANVKGLLYLSPGSAQVLMQLAPLALILGGVVLFKEGFTRLQHVGIVTLLVGLALFFQHRLPQILASETENVLGIALIIGAALAWAGYALIQKPLLQHLNAMQLTLVMYVLGALMLLPFSHLHDIYNISPLQGFALVFCCLNTLIAYGAFTEALRVWYASRVSAVIALAPVFTFISTYIAERIMPEVFTQPHLGWTAMVGAALVVSGSMITALGRSGAKPIKS